MSYDPQRVGHYGKLVELWAERNYPLELEYPMVDGLRFDAVDDRGRPWDIKGTMLNGVRPTFKFWKDQHDTLAAEDGGYALVWYRARENSIAVEDSRTIKARNIRIDNWTNPGATHHRSHTKEAQVPAHELR
ncbi:hypothetical protein [Natrialba swarupiae]|uniref:PD(D/E)XK endonuclease domain-containing protein n=1 Tax=Natrialba swarupiae TaxID=2448032 RepID=A0A5D5ALR3_9EURY|nr:hypothetical protein [Natrialba swarupiae]MCW8172796.1 hypothetical protein [Natrialba swarupiae]TYT61797.1 hypothetical protein FYC77_11165 [Natrialba swarupiae]